MFRPFICKKTNLVLNKIAIRTHHKKKHNHVLPRKEISLEFTVNQKKLLTQLNDKVRFNDSKLVVVTGPAGSGKTMLLCKKAFEMLRHEDVDKVLITRPLVTVDEDLGYLPGNINNKTEPWLKPIYDYMYKYFEPNEIHELFRSQKIEICPLAYMRGRTLDNTYIIADEMQNSTIKQMKMLLSRIGNNSMMAINGDFTQSDIVENGLYDFLQRYENSKEDMCYLNISHIRFESEDIRRNEIINDVLNIYKNNNTRY